MDEPGTAVSPMPDPTVQLRPYAGHSPAESPIVEHTAGHWGGRVTVRRQRLRPARGSRADWWIVQASWTGPPMHGFPPLPAIAERHDTIALADLGHAKAVAAAANDELRATRVPDLRALAERLRRRR